MWKYLRRAWVKTIPIMCGYLFLGFAFGVSLQQAGFGVIWAVAISVFVYAGSLQFMMIPLLVSNASLFTMFFTTLFVNCRHIFYGLTFIERFRKVKHGCPYLIFSLTDETYSVLCSQKDVEQISDRELFFIHLLDHLYWIIGSFAGACFGSVIKLDLTGIDFAMTALFGVIFYEQMENANSYLPALVGLLSAVCSFFLFGADQFLLPALILAVLLLCFLRPWIEVKQHE